MAPVNSHHEQSRPITREGIDSNLLPLYDAHGCKYPPVIPPVGCFYMRQLLSTNQAGKGATPINWIPEKLPYDRATIFCHQCSTVHDPALCRSPIMQQRGPFKIGDLPDHCGACGQMHQIELCKFVRAKIIVPGRKDEMPVYLYALWYARQGLWPFQTKIDLSRLSPPDDDFVFEVFRVAPGKDKAARFARLYANRINQWDYSSEHTPGGIIKACTDPRSERHAVRSSQHRHMLRGPVNTGGKKWDPLHEPPNWRERGPWGIPQPLPEYAYRESPILLDQHGFVTAVWKPGDPDRVYPLQPQRHDCIEELMSALHISGISQAPPEPQVCLEELSSSVIPSRAAPVSSSPAQPSPRILNHTPGTMPVIHRGAPECVSRPQESDAEQQSPMSLPPRDGSGWVVFLPNSKWKPTTPSQQQGFW